MHWKSSALVVSSSLIVLCLGLAPRVLAGNTSIARPAVPPGTTVAVTATPTNVVADAAAEVVIEAQLMRNTGPVRAEAPVDFQVIEGTAKLVHRDLRTNGEGTAVAGLVAPAPGRVVVKVTCKGAPDCTGTLTLNVTAPEQ